MMVDRKKISRRKLLLQGSTSLASWAAFYKSLSAQGFSSRPGEELVPFLDRTPDPPREGDRNLLKWQELNSWVTPNKNFFRVSHYNEPAVNERDWRLEVTGLVSHPKKFTLADLKARKQKELFYTLECSGNHGFPFFVGAIGNARWAGVQLATILREAGLKDTGIEVIFFRK